MAEQPGGGPPLDAVRIIEALALHEVQYVIVGGAAAVSYGATRVTADVDCVVRRDRGNLDRLAAAMRDLNARLDVEGMTDEEAKQLPVQLDARTLASLEISTWMTDAGGLDILVDIPTAAGALVGYEDLAERANVIQGEGVVVRVAALEDVIASKEWVGRPKDLEALPELYGLRDAARAKRLADLSFPGPLGGGVEPPAARRDVPRAAGRGNREERD